MPEAEPRGGSWLTCSCLPNKIAGVDTDAVFAYETPKVVRIQDRTLGLLKLIFMLAVVVYVFVFSMWFKGQHFKATEVEGVARLQWQEPVQNCNPKDKDCFSNFESATNLPYCSQSQNAYDGPKLACSFFDARELPIPLSDGVLLPTRRDVFKQGLSQDCRPPRFLDVPERCDKRFVFLDADGKEQTGSGDAVPVDSTFVADADDFTLLIDHSFRTSNGMMECDDHFMQGYWDKCDQFGENCVQKPIHCVHSECEDVGVKTCGERFDNLLDKTIARLARQDVGLLQKRKNMRTSRRGLHTVQLKADLDQLSGHAKAALRKQGQRDPNKDIAISIGLGDVFSLRTLLAMANKSLDTEIPDASTGSPSSMRSRGTVLVVDITYFNWREWTLWKTADPPWYIIKVTSRPVEEFKHQSLALETNVSRELHVDYGVYIIVNQRGRLLFPNLLGMIITFAAGLVLLSVSNVLTDQMMLRLLPRSETYKDLKYLVSEDMCPQPTSPDEEKKREAEASAQAAANNQSQELQVMDFGGSVRNAMDYFKANPDDKRFVRVWSSSAQKWFQNSLADSQTFSPCEAPPGTDGRIYRPPDTTTAGTPIMDTCGSVSKAMAYFQTHPDDKRMVRVWSSTERKWYQNSAGDSSSFNPCEESYPPP